MSGHEELIQAAGERDDARATRLVTLSVGVRLEGERGLVLAGNTTGLNENGLGARVNLVSGRLPADPAGIHLRVALNLPREREFLLIESEILHVSPCWVPGYRLFTAVRFLRVDPDDITFLRNFIRWREDDHFTPEKPIRKWYVFTQEEQRVFGPLTRDEIIDAAQRGAIRSCDLIWSPMRGEWISCPDGAMETKLRSIEDEEFAPFAAAGASEGVPHVATTAPPPAREAASVPRESPAELLAGLAAPLPVANSPAEPLFAPSPDAPFIPRRWIVAGLIILVFAGLVAGFIEGTLDRTEPGLILHDARRALEENDSSRAIQRFASLRQQFPGHRLAVRAEEALIELLRKERREREGQIGLSRLDLLNRLPDNLRADPVVLNAIGDCLFRSGEYAGAIERFEKAVLAAPSNGIYQYNLGTALLRRGDFPKAAERLNEPGLEMGSDPRYHFNAGIAFMGIKDKGRQRSFFDTAERLAANHAWLGLIIAAADQQIPATAEEIFTTMAEPLDRLEAPGDLEVLRRLQADQPNVAIVPFEAISGETIVKAPPHMRHLLLADFDLDGVTEREIVCAAGPWSSRLESLNIRSSVTHDPRNRVGDFGASLRIDYNLFADEPGEAGAWMLLEKRNEPLDMTSSRFLVLQLRGGEEDAIFPGNVLIELRNRAESSRVLLAGVSKDWREFRIPLVHFTGITDWRAMTELLIVIDSTGGEKRSGVLRVDSIRLEG